MYDSIIDLIERSKVAFPKYGTGVSQQAVASAELSLGIIFPESYKWWLLQYGGGQIKGDIIYGLDEVGAGRPDIVELAKMNEQDGLYSKEQLVFSMGNAENYYFDTTRLEGGEYPVLTHDLTQDDTIAYARSFEEFLQKRIREKYGVV